MNIYHTNNMPIKMQLEKIPWQNPNKEKIVYYSLKYVIKVISFKFLIRKFNEAKS